MVSFNYSGSEFHSLGPACVKVLSSVLMNRLLLAGSFILHSYSLEARYLSLCLALGLIRGGASFWPVSYISGCSMLPWLFGHPVTLRNPKRPASYELSYQTELRCPLAY